MNSTRAVQAINILLLMLVIGVPLIFVQETMFPFILVKTALFKRLPKSLSFSGSASRSITPSVDPDALPLRCVLRRFWQL